MPSVERLGRLFFALALIGFGLENIAFGHYVVARAAPWPADPAQQHLIAYVTGVLFLASGGAILVGRWTPRGGARGRRADPRLVAVPALADGNRGAGLQRRLDQRAQGGGAGRRAVRRGRSRRNAERALRTLARRPARVGAFFLLAGIQHFLFVQFVETLVPPFIPFPRFWTYVAAAALLAAGFGFWRRRSAVWRRPAPADGLLLGVPGPCAR